MKTARVDRYWRETFGLAQDRYEQPGVIVTAHSARLAGRNACWLFVRGETCVISVPPRLVACVRRRSETLRPDAVLSEKSLGALFGDGMARTVGPSYQGYAEKEDFRPSPDDHVRKLSPSDRNQLQEFFDHLDSTEADLSGLTPQSDPLFGYFDRGCLLAVAGILPWAPYAANLGAVTHPAHRRMGLGRAVTSAAMRQILEAGNVVLFQTLESNRGAVRIAEALGCKLYARMLCVELKKDAGQPPAPPDQ